MKIKLAAFFQKRPSKLLVVVIIGLLFPWVSFAINNDLVAFLANFFYSVFVYAPGVIFSWVVAVFGSVVAYNNFTNESIINLGWTVLRDVANMFFIIVLLTIAIGTILRSQRYGYQQNLRRLVVMAILINFSKTITLFFIELSQIITLYFVNLFRDSLDAGIPTLLGITSALTLDASSVGGATPFTGDNVANDQLVLMRVILAAAMIIIALIVMVVLTAIFVMRIVYFAFIIILSPIAFAASTLPTAFKYYTEWWDMLGKYLVVGPAIAFFLWLSFTMVAQQSIIGLSQEEYTSTQANLGRDSTAFQGGGVNDLPKDSLGDILKRYFMGIAMLLGTLAMANRFGVAGGSLAATASGKITGGMKSIAKFPGRAVGAGVSFGARRAMVGKSGEGGLRGQVSLASGQRAGQVLDRLSPTLRASFIGRGLEARQRGAAARTSRDVAWQRDQLKHSTNESLRAYLNDGNQRKREAAAAELQSRHDGVRDGAAGTGEREQVRGILQAGGQRTREQYEKFSEANVMYIQDPTERTDTIRRAVREGRAEKMVGDMDGDYFQNHLDDAEREVLLTAFRNNGVNDEIIEKGVKRWTRDQQNAFAQAYAAAFSGAVDQNGNPDNATRQRALRLQTRLNPGSFADNFDGQDANHRNVASAMSAEDLAKLSATQIQRLALHLSASQVQAFGSKGSLEQLESMVNHANAASDKVVKAIMSSDAYAQARVSVGASNPGRTAALGQRWQQVENYDVQLQAYKAYHDELQREAARQQNQAPTHPGPPPV